MNWQKIGRQFGLGVLCSVIAWAIFNKQGERFAFILTMLIVDGWICDICEAIRDK